MCARRPARVMGIVGPGGRFEAGRAGAHVHFVLLSVASEALERGISNVERGAEDPARHAHLGPGLAAHRPASHQPSSTSRATAAPARA